MAPFKYLIHFSYIGALYHGVIEQANLNTVQLKVRKAFESILGSNKASKICSKFYISSRTDAGVHAFHNTGVIDLDFDTQINSYENYKFDLNSDQLFCDDLTFKLNKYLNDNREAVRVLKIQKVKPKFNVRRSVESRTYLYRLAVLKNGEFLWNEYKKRLDQYLKDTKSTKKKGRSFAGPKFEYVNFPGPFESDFITPIREPFNYDLFEKAVKLCIGQHNFSAFTTKNGRNDMITHHRSPVKTLKIDVTHNDTGQFMNEYLNESCDKFKIIELEITGESFLYKMIRRMVGSFVDVAKEQIDLKTIEKMLLCPPDYYDNSKKTLISALLPNGLFLKNVKYLQDSLRYDINDYILHSKEINYNNKNNNLEIEDNGDNFE